VCTCVRACVRVCMCICVYDYMGAPSVASRPEQTQCMRVLVCVCMCACVYVYMGTLFVALLHKSRSFVSSVYLCVCVRV